MRYLNKIISCILISIIVCMPLMSGCADSSEVTVLRVANWEEYIDMGDWDEDEIIELEDGSTVFGEKDLMSEFEDWYYDTHHKRIKVEYSCFGTNEELYNQLTLGSVYDLVCPSEYMIMKLMSENWASMMMQCFFIGASDLVTGFLAVVRTLRSCLALAEALLMDSQGMLRQPERTAEGVSSPTLNPLLTLVPSGAKLAYL